MQRYRLVFHNLRQLQRRVRSSYHVA
jgi:hypothetical protein